MKTYTRKGAIKLAITDPVGPHPSDSSISVTQARDSETAQQDEALELLRQIAEDARFIKNLFAKARL